MIAQRICTSGLRESRARRYARTVDAPEASIALLLDIDGTLVEFESHPDAVRLDRTLIALLAELETGLGGALGMVSGRSVEAIDRLLHPVKLPAVGLHGAQYRMRAGDPVHVLAATLPDRLRADVGALARRSDVRIVEDKAGIAIALHVADDSTDSAELEQSIDGMLSSHAPQWALFRGRRVLEIKPRAHSKGSGCAQLMRDVVFANRMPVYLGDDTTDLDAFDTVRALGGINVAVGARVAHAADIVLDTPAVARAWLAQFSRWVLREAPAPSPLLTRRRG